MMMELINLLSIPPPVLLAALLVILYMVVVVIINNKWRMIITSSKTQNQKSKLPPGPWKLPLLGNLHNMLGLPHRTLEDLAKKHGPVMHLQLGELSLVVISSAKAAEQVMKTHDLIFANRPKILAVEMLPLGSFDVAFAPYGSYWRQMRKIFKLELLSAKRVQSFRSIREEEVSNLIQNINSSMAAAAAAADQSSPMIINITERLFSLTGDITARAAFGKKCKDKEVFLASIREVVRLASGFGVADLFPSIKFLQVISGLKPKLERLHKKIDKILDNIINEHREKMIINNGNDDHIMEDEDLVDVLVRLQESGETDIPITNNHIKAAILDIFSAGTETTSSTIEWVMSEMLRNPRVMKKAQAEVRKVLSIKNRNSGTIDETEVQNLKYLKLVIKETLRFRSATPLLLPRECKEICVIHGYEIPVKTKVIVNAFAIGRDPENWGTNADRFEPERFEEKGSLDYNGTNFEYLPFGAGRRVCPGILFGLANAELPIAQLLYHFDWKLPNGVKPENLDMSEAFGATVRRKNDLYLIAIPYVADEYQSN